MSPALKRYRDATIVVLLLAVPFFVLKANMKSPENQNGMDRTILRISAPIELAAATLARGVGDVWDDYVYLVDVKKDNERLRYENARLREEVHSLEQAQVEVIARVGGEFRQFAREHPGRGGRANGHGRLLVQIADDTRGARARAAGESGQCDAH